MNELSTDLPKFSSLITEYKSFCEISTVTLSSRYRDELNYFKIFLNILISRLEIMYFIKLQIFIY